MFDLPANKSANLTLYPLLWLAIGFSGGIAAAKFFDFEWKIALASCSVFAFLTLVFLRRRFVAVFLLAAFASLGAFVFHTDERFAAPNRLRNLFDESRINSGDPSEIEGVLRGNPSSRLTVFTWK